MFALRGDRELDSENLTAYEMGYRLHPRESFSLDLAIFYNRYHDLRSFDPGDPFLAGSPLQVVTPVFAVNDMEGNTYGAELALDWLPVNWWRLQGAYTYLHIQLNDPATLNYLSKSIEGESPDHQFSIRSSMDLPKELELDLWLKYVDSIPAENISSIYTTDARLGWKPTKALEISIVGQNLLDHHHPEFVSELEHTLPSEVERSVYGKFTWRFR